MCVDHTCYSLKCNFKILIVLFVKTMRYLESWFVESFVLLLFFNDIADFCHPSNKTSNIVRSIVFFLSPNPLYITDSIAF